MNQPVPQPPERTVRIAIFARNIIKRACLAGPGCGTGQALDIDGTRIVVGLTEPLGTQVSFVNPRIMAQTNVNNTQPGTCPGGGSPVPNADIRIIDHKAYTIQVRRPSGASYIVGPAEGMARSVVQIYRQHYCDASRSLFRMGYDHYYDFYWVEYTDDTGRTTRRGIPAPEWPPELTKPNDWPASPPNTWEQSQPPNPPRIPND